MRYLLFIFLILCISPILAEDIVWEKDLDKAFDKSANSNKPMLVYFTMDNCIYCQRMENITLKDSRVIEAIKKVIPVKLKYELQPDNVRIFNVQGFPTTLIVQPKTVDNKRILSIMSRKSGFISSSEILDIIKINEPKE